MRLRRIRSKVVKNLSLNSKTAPLCAAAISCIIVLAILMTILVYVLAGKILPVEFVVITYAFVAPAIAILFQGSLILLRKGDQLTLLKGLLHAQRLVPLTLLGILAVPAIFPNDLATTEALQEITAGLGAFCLIIAFPYFITMYAIGVVEKGQKQGSNRPLTMRVQRSRIKRSGLAR